MLEFEPSVDKPFAVEEAAKVGVEAESVAEIPKPIRVLDRDPLVEPVQEGIENRLREWGG